MLLPWAHQMMAAHSGGGGPTPLAVADFKNGIYSIGGVAKTLDEMFGDPPPSWGGVRGNPTPGVGYTRSAPDDTGNHNPSPTPELFAALDWANGITILFQYQISSDGVEEALISVDLYQDPDYSFGAYFNARGQTHVAAQGVYDGPEATSALPNGAHKSAVTLAVAEQAMSTDGGAVETCANGDDFSLYDVGVFFVSCPSGAVGEVILEKLTFYSAQPNDILPTLSA